MKKIALSFLLVLSACGEYTTTGTSSSNSNLTGPRSLELQVVSGDVRNAVTSVCNALAQKESILPTAIGSNHSFTSSQTDCEGNELSSPLNVVTIQGNNLSGFIFKKADGLDFIFPDVETPTKGIFVDLCANVSNLQNPIIGFSEVTFFNTSSACPSASGEVCLEIVKAFVQGNQAIPHTSDVIRVRTNSSQGRIGFFTYRKRVSKSFCGNNKSITLSATLK